MRLRERPPLTPPADTSSSTLTLFNNCERRLGGNSWVYYVDTKKWHLYTHGLSINMSEDVADVDFTPESRSTHITGQEIVFVYDLILGTKALIDFEAMSNAEIPQIQRPSILRVTNTNVRMARAFMHIGFEMCNPAQLSEILLIQKQRNDELIDTDTFHEKIKTALEQKGIDMKARWEDTVLALTRLTNQGMVARAVRHGGTKRA